MSGTFAWTCPYCQRDTTITESNYTNSVSAFNDGNKDGLLAFVTSTITCPNPECKEYTIRAALHRGAYEGGIRAKGVALAKWQLRPNSSAKPLPDYIPRSIVEDYNEACLIRDLSPKASATLSRRCLQGMIRDFWGISKSRLIDEIKALEDKVDPETWGAIDAIRDLGNIGAHMEKDINIIVEVDPDEAQMLIDLIELLVKEWYIARYNREQRVSGIKKLAAEKKAAKKPDPSDS